MRALENKFKKLNFALVPKKTRWTIKPNTSQQTVEKESQKILTRFKNFITVENTTKSSSIK